MVRMLYHGSDHIIERPIFGAGKAYNDYGLGFYCTEDPDMAKEWGVTKDRDGYANCYELDCGGLDILDLSDGSYCILHWLAILLENREFDVPSRSICLTDLPQTTKRWMPSWATGRTTAILRSLKTL